MKQNKMMRLASFLLVGVLMTTSSITTTFAKYTTQNSSYDSARVAKWGVTILSEGKLFDNTYLSGSNQPGGDSEDGTDGTTLSVESSESVVAPGTKNSTGLKIQLDGTPEVDVMVTFKASTTKGNIFLDGLGLPDLTTPDETDTFDAEDYFPVRFTLSRNGSVASEDKNLKLQDLISKINSLSQRYDAGTDLSQVGTYVITWEWLFSGNDQEDTLLGSLESDETVFSIKTLEEGLHYNLETDLKLDVTVTQVD